MRKVNQFLLRDNFAFTVGDVGIKGNGSDFFVTGIAKNSDQSASWSFGLNIEVNTSLFELSWKTFAIFSFATSDSFVLFV